jgi:membrane fusion protein (multidrug efflux system)
VFFVSPTLDPEGRRILLKAWVPNPDRRLQPGLFATIEAEVERRDDALLVPESAVVYEVDGVYVWRLAEGDVAERSRVELGLHVEGRVEVRAGLAAGDPIVTAGTHKLLPGKAVRRAEPQAARAAEASEGERGS